MITDPTITRIGQGVELHHHRGHREAARDLFVQIWHDIGAEQGDPLHVCVLAHAMADVQDDGRQELVWDLRALAAADRVTDERVAQAGVTLAVAGLYPSLHLNVSECYRKLGDLGRAPRSASVVTNERHSDASPVLDTGLLDDAGPPPVGVAAVDPRHLGHVFGAGAVTGARPAS